MENLKTKLKNARIDIQLQAIITLAIGVILIAWPDQVATLLGRIIALVIIVSGLVVLIPELLAEVKRTTSIIASAIIVAVGIWLFISPTAVTSIIPIAIGILMIVHGVGDINMSIEAKHYGWDKWWSSIITGALSLIFGIICIVNAFGVVKVGFMIMGIMLLIDGITDIVIAIFVSKAEKDYTRGEIIDVEVNEES